MEKDYTSQDELSLRKLRRSWLAYGVIAYVYLALGMFVLQANWNTAYALRWFIQAGLTIAYVLIVLIYHLDQNRLSSNNVLLPKLGWGNRATLLRGLFIASLAGFVFSPWPGGWLAWLPGVFYCLIAITDILDGYLARRTQQVTRLGATLDMSLDSLGVLFASTLLVQYGQVPPFYIIVGLARYLYLSGGWLFQLMGRTLSELPPRRHRRIFASLQFAFIGIVLFPVFSPPLTWWAAAFFSLPFLIGFLLDFLLVINVIQLSSMDRIKLPKWLVQSIQVSLRLLMFVLGTLQFFQVVSQTARPTIDFLALIFWIVNGFILIGLAGRISAGIALILVGLSPQIIPITVVQIIQVAGYIALIYIGTGPRSLWSPEEVWLGLRSGSSKRMQGQKSQHETNFQTN